MNEVIWWMFVSKRANNFMKKLKFRFGSSRQFSVRSSNSTCKSADLAVFGGGAEDLRNDIFVYRVASIKLYGSDLLHFAKLP